MPLAKKQIEHCGTRTRGLLLTVLKLIRPAGFEPGSIDFDPSARPLSQACFGVKMFTIVGMSLWACGAAYV